MAVGPMNIDGAPEAMGKYDTTKSLRNFDPQTEFSKETKLESAMAEGRAFAAKDTKAVTDLTAFVEQTGHQLRSATLTAHADKHEYIGADKEVVTKFREIAFQPSSLPGEPPTLQKKPDA